MKAPDNHINYKQSSINRASVILSTLLVLFLVLSVSSVYLGWKNNELEKRVFAPIREWFNELGKAFEPAPSPLAIVLPSPFLTPTAKPTVTPQKAAPVVNKQPVVSNCTRKNIREGEFASNKCYSPQDYEDLQYYLGRYNSSVFERDSQESFIKVTCPGMSDMFKQSCEEHKQKKAAAEADINKYRDIVNSIIAKGK